MAKVNKVNATTPDVIDLNLPDLQSKRFRIDGDDNRILVLNTSDMNILSRLKEVYPKLVTLTQDAVKKLPMDMDIPEDEFTVDSEAVTTMVDVLTEIDTKMRELIDYLFNSNVSEMCAPNGSMYDPVNGKFRYEHIIDTLSKLYTDDITSGVNQITARVKKHTDKYVKR